MLNLKPLRNKNVSLWLLLDLFMIVLLMINISWIIFDSLYMVDELNNVLRVLLGDRLINWYGEALNPHFYAYDLIFVAIFASELLFRWAWAVYHRTYGHWLAYPVLHWYDVLGCIPLGGFRMLRLLRVFSIGVRLQKAGVIDVRKWWLFKQLQKLYAIVMEEISDRVVVQVISGMQDELQNAGGIEAQIIDDVVKPRQQRLVQAIGLRLSRTVGVAYTQNREPLERYIKTTVSEAVRANREVRTIDKMPLVGGVVTGLLDDAITDIVCGVVERAVEDLDSKEFQQLFDGLVNTSLDGLLDTSTAGSSELTAAINEILEVVKQQVAIRQWLDPKVTENSDSAAGTTREV